MVENRRLKYRYLTVVTLLGFLIVVSLIFGKQDISRDYVDHQLYSANFYPEVSGNVADFSVSIIKTADWMSREGFLYSGGRWLAERKGVHSAVLIRHSERVMLFDTGLGRNIGRQFIDRMPFWLKPFMAYENHQPARDLLVEEVARNPIRTIILSHLHWDHISGLEDFHDAEEVWVTKEAYDWLMASNAEEKLYIEQFLARHKKIKWRFIRFDSGPYENFEKSFDVFQDDRVVLVPLPGHSPGSLGMFVNLHSGKRLFFTGDVTWVLESFQLLAHKFWAARMLADHDQVKLEQTIRKVHQLMKLYPDMTVIPAHDYDAQHNIGFFPDIID